MLDWAAVSYQMKKHGFPRKQFMNPLRISLALLHSEKKISELVSLGLSEEYANIVVDIWKPKPESKEGIEAKEAVRKGLPELFKLLATQVGSLVAGKLVPTEPATYETLQSHFASLEETFASAVSRMEKEAIANSNPYLTISVKESYDRGIEFQIAAKLASSVETSWGCWIQKIIPMFNPSVVAVGAGGFDCVLHNTSYDIKSGPNVMNKDQVEEAKQKRATVRDLASLQQFKGLVAVNDFKVAISYGKKSIARMFMREPTGLIIFGAETWREITGDEWNAYQLFIWQLKHKIESHHDEWTKDGMTAAVEQFMNSFYDDPVGQLLRAQKSNEYLELQRQFSTA
jgi:hypothetical protein